MPTLVLGATGATGRLLVAQLLSRGEPVRAIVRSPDRLPEEIRSHDLLEVTAASVLDLPDEELANQVMSCGAVASCLGHNLTLRGVFGPPRRLVTDAVRRVCAAVESHRPAQPVRLVLMSSAGVRNKDLNERVSTAQRCVLGLIRALVPPHADNEGAAEFLRSRIGRQSSFIEWAVVRPDTLINAEQVSGYTLHASPTRSAIFDPGKTSRINVAHVMAELATRDDLWAEWRGRMPVVYNRD
ncbi:hypothetical protein KOR34_41410 [Posidoniimonas corsicana]|uniref:NAD(P)-binding domain-containing protein n=1 Tax=Posidoniimonas corsicana TaxID=1938618 RepID=A0A5C5V1M9_9BACT|nr:NAD(P)-binding oxidoreductase [Posidoniimonas corsicana]TWT32378.1 hypothetical protein KOR34_41410 [Posidoniimonas corsicana]